MERKKYELTEECKEHFGRKLYRIKALIDFGDVKTGDLGGYIESENNLSHNDNCWVFGDAEVCGNAWVYGDARVFGDAWVYGDAEVCGNAWVYGDARVFGDAEVCGNAWVYGDARVFGDAEIRVCADYTTIKGFGTECRNTTFFRCKDGAVRVKCGCFYGTIEEFRTQVNNTRDGKIAKEYLMIADLMEYHFAKE